MKYIVKHIKYGTYYCFNDYFKCKEYKVDCEKAYRFNRKCDANRIIRKLKHPENWKVVEVMSK